jgi:hypothetical protein
MTPVIVDTGFLVALFDPTDSLARAAARYLKAYKHPLVTVSAAVVEACFYFGPHRKAELLTWIRTGGCSVVEVPATAYAQLELTIRKYADQDIDFVDAAIVWLANETGARRVLTVDVRDFAVFRLRDQKRFELIDWI